MKKYGAFIILLESFILPLRVFAYSDKVYLGGNNVGINIKSDGIMVVGFYKINNTYNSARLMTGDYIVKVNNDIVNNISDLVDKIDKYVSNNTVSITYRRDGKLYNTDLVLEYNDGIYKTGLYVKDAITGNGTLTYIDPSTKIYGALGHKIIESSSNSKVEIKDGSIFKTVISNISKSNDGSPGSINTKFYKSTIYGSIDKNLDSGIFGEYVATFNEGNLIEVSNIDDIKLGSAYIYTSLDNNQVSKYEIKILRIDKNNDIKNIYFEVVDNNLLDIAGGIVQGMSGSPIVQNDKLIGAVTHVLVDDVKHGYGISIIKMLEDGERE